MLKGLDIATIKGINRYLPYVEYNNGKLHVLGRALSDYAADFQRPTLLYIPQRAHDNARSFMQAFSKYFKKFRGFYALKSCYMPSIVQAIRKEGFYIEVMSEYELKIANLCGFSADKISLNGVGRIDEYQMASVQSDIHINFLDSIDDIKLLAALAKEKNCTLNVGLRVNPPQVDNSLYIRESNKLGLDWQGGHFLEALKEVRSHNNLKLKAILCHQFYHLTDTKKFGTLLEQYAALIIDLYKNHNQQFEIIDIGGGFETRFLMEHAGVSIEDFARTAAEKMSIIPYSFLFQAQPGRYLTADTAIGFTTVTAEKKMSQSNWLITDIGSNVLVPIPGLVYHPLPENIKQDEEWVTYDLGDGTCAPSTVCRECTLPAQSKGHKLLLLNCGGYTTVFSQIWAFALPDIFIAQENGQLKQHFGYSNFTAMVQNFYGYKI